MPAASADRGPLYIAVIGPGDGASGQACAAAEQVGRQLALAGATVVCGGLGGVMAAACRGAAGCGGQTVGLLPGTDRGAGNRFLSVALPTGLGELRNGLVAAASDAVIAVDCSWGTLSEIALAIRAGKPTVVLGGLQIRAGDWQADAADQPGGGPLVLARSAGQAVTLALALALAAS